MKLLAASIISISILAGCASPYGNIVSKQPVNLSGKQVSEVQSAVTYSLKDPTSAMYRNIRGTRIKTDKERTFITVCGEVNGRNAFGGYVGFTPFHGDFDESGKFTLRNIDSYGNSLSQLACMN